MQIINGHSVERFYSGGHLWLVDGSIYCDDLVELSDCIGLSVAVLEEVLD